MNMMISYQELVRTFLIDGYHSAEFKKYILSHPQYDGYLLPDYLK
ncbi:D-methionine transport system substrate-binding protein [Klebsiella pneumoniae]|nr:D-methionine transport system substrate-binding protein [Klebsiella pneumoniae]